MTLPNLISVLRLLLVPVIVAMIVSGQDRVAFWLFVLAGISDAADGIIARRFALHSELGAYLDPIADKALLVATYLSLALIGALPAWLVIAVISRDILIVGAVILSWMLAKPMPMHPLMVSKANTVVQIMLASVVLAQAGLELSIGGLRLLLIAIVAGLTTASAVAYLMEWVRHMAPDKSSSGAARPENDTRKGTNE